MPYALRDLRRAVDAGVGECRGVHLGGVLDLHPQPRGGHAVARGDVAPAAEGDYAGLHLHGIDVGRFGGSGRRSLGRRSRRASALARGLCGRPLVGVPIVEDDDQGHRRDKGHGDTGGVEDRLVEGRNRQDRTEDECLGRHAVAEAHDEAAEDAAAEHQRVDPLEPQMDAVEGRFGDAAHQARHQRARRRLPHLLLTIAPGEEEHPGRRAVAGEVPRAHRALDVVVAQGADVHEHDGVDGPVQAERHHERVDEGYEQREDERRQSVDRLQGVGEPGSHVDAGGPDEVRRQGHHDEHGEEGDEDELDVGRDDLLQEFVQRPQQRGYEQRREDLRTVVEYRHREAEDVDDGVFLSLGYGL